MKLKPEYTDAKVEHNGIRYDFRNMNEERLQRVWETNPQLRHYFIEQPEAIKEEEFFTEEIFNAAIKDYINDTNRDPLTRAKPAYPKLPTKPAVKRTPKNK